MAFVRLLAGVLLGMVLSALFLPPFAPSAKAQDTVMLAAGSTVSLATPTFLQKGKRYSFTWPGGGPPQTFIVKDTAPQGWILVEVAEENVDPAFAPIGSLPTRWLNAAIATSIQEMRPIVY